MPDTMSTPTSPKTTGRASQTTSTHGRSMSSAETAPTRARAATSGSVTSPRNGKLVHQAPVGLKRGLSFLFVLVAGVLLLHTTPESTQKPIREMYIKLLHQTGAARRQQLRHLISLEKKLGYQRTSVAADLQSGSYLPPPTNGGVVATTPTASDATHSSPDDQSAVAPPLDTKASAAVPPPLLKFVAVTPPLVVPPPVAPPPNVEPAVASPPPEVKSDLPPVPDAASAPPPVMNAAAANSSPVADEPSNPTTFYVSNQAGGIVAQYPTPKPEPKDVIMTMIAGNSAARHAIALVQSLRDVNTQADAIIVLIQQGGPGSPECSNWTWKVERKRETITCQSPDANAEDIVSTKYLEALRRLNAVLIVTPEITRTQWTETISGGRQMSWGMSLNKMAIFNMTQYRKIVFMDADTLVFKNLDHLFGPEYPMFTAAYTYACCNVVAAPIPSGGFWVVEPDISWGIKAWELMAQGKPVYNPDGSQKMKADGSGFEYVVWYLSDLDLVRAMFTDFVKVQNLDPMWPAVNDARHGYTPGMRSLPKYRNMTDAEFSRHIVRRGETMKEGFLPELWDGKTPVWRALDGRYDQCVGMCECLPERDFGDDFVSVHFSCVPMSMHKPGWYEDEAQFYDELYTYALGCTRHYYLDRWLPKLHKAGITLAGPPYTGPPVPRFNETHDEVVRANRVAQKARREQELLDVRAKEKKAREDAAAAQSK